MRKKNKGQTMVEYSLILAAVAMIAFGAYHVLGNGVTTLVSGIDSMLTAA